VTFTVGDEPHKMEAGAWSVVPPGVEHGLEAGQEGAEVLAIVVPARASASAYIVVEANDAV